ncbi:MAG TPA: SRPBCC family protein [Rhizomicrobium sp.]|jgi:hypothetical protein
MASIRREVSVDIPAASAWSALADFGNAGALFAGVLTKCRRIGDVRMVTFANGRQIAERLVALDNGARRIVYTALNGTFSHHSASMQIVEDGPACKFVWTSDFLPDEAAANVAPLVEAGCRAIKQNLEQAFQPAARTG